MEEIPPFHDLNALPEGWVELCPPLPALGILAGLSDVSLANIASFGQYHQCAPGTEVIREGEMQDRFYVVVAGRLSITVSVHGSEVALNEAGPGECLGEVSLLEPGAATATVRSIEDSALWSMDIDDFRSYLMRHAGGAGVLLLGIASCLSQRLRHANELISQNRVMPIETLPAGRQRAITASNTIVHLGFFERVKQVKQSFTTTKKIRISTKIKM
jgi:CRP/FNR family cyclic AMP-dependent transcriptional regulator